MALRLFGSSQGIARDVAHEMRNTTAKRDIVILAPRHGAGALPSPAVLKKARLLAKKKGKRLVIPSPTGPLKNGEESGVDTEIVCHTVQDLLQYICLICSTRLLLSGKLFGLEQYVIDGEGTTRSTMGRRFAAVRLFCQLPSASLLDSYVNYVGSWLIMALSCSITTQR